MYSLVISVIKSVKDCTESAINVEKEKNIPANNFIIATKKLEGYHTMSSIYEAHQIFGGIYSESLIGEGRDAKLQYSEASNYVVANLVNNVTILTELGKESKTRELNQNYYE